MSNHPQAYNKAITIRQPWASLIALGVKTIETRSWRTTYRGPIAIHAGLAKPKLTDTFDCITASDAVKPMPELRVGDWVVREAGDLFMRLAYPESGTSWDDPRGLDFGAVIATATLTDCLPIVDPCNIDVQDVGSYVLDTIPSSSWLCRSYIHDDRTVSSSNREDQLPYGDFTPGRYGWMLTDITPVTPVPAKGRQGLWNWEAPSAVTA